MKYSLIDRQDTDSAIVAITNFVGEVSKTFHTDNSMMIEDPRTLQKTNFTFPGLKKIYHGKVRDVYIFSEQLAMIASDRISAFDHVLPRAIPYKGQVLNQLAAFFLQATSDLVPNWLETVPHPNVSMGIACQPYPVEMVIRGYLAGHAWRVYRDGGRELCGVSLPDGLKEGDRLATPIITPATKAKSGHDEDISREEIIRQKIVPEKEYEQLEHYTRLLFQRGTEMAKERGLLLVDTKYEFGQKDGQIYLIDEIHTPDSSRYYYQQGYELRQQTGEKQKQLSKEFVREWLMENGFQGLEGQLMPTMPDAFVDSVTERYIELYETLTGRTFERGSTTDLQDQIKKAILEKLT